MEGCKCIFDAENAMLIKNIKLHFGYVWFKLPRDGTGKFKSDYCMASADLLGSHSKRSGVFVNSSGIFMTHSRNRTISSD